MRAWVVVACAWWWVWPAAGFALSPESLAAVAAAVQARFFSSCVVRIQRCPPGFAESVNSVWLEKNLAMQPQALTFAAHNSTSGVRHCPRNKVLTIADLSYVTTPEVFTQGVRRDVAWLVAVNGSSWQKRLEHWYVPLDALLLVAEPLAGGQLVEIMEVFSPRPGKPASFAFFGRWTRATGLFTKRQDVTALYRRRTSLDGAELTVTTYHDPPTVTVTYIGTKIIVGGYFGEVWNTLEGRLRFNYDDQFRSYEIIFLDVVELVWSSAPRDKWGCSTPFPRHRRKCSVGDLI